MLKDGGVLAICIDDNEISHLLPMLNEIFGEENRVGIINWQKNYGVRGDPKNIVSTTEYVLVYAKDKNFLQQNSLSRGEKMLSYYKNPDNDPKGA
jgi:adenine-specific DNA-methyltransferase